MEAGNALKNEQGTIAMARTSVPDSATAQFFISVADNASLNAQAPTGQGYPVFGRVVQGMDTVDRIRLVPVISNGPFQNLPANTVAINFASVIPVRPKWTGGISAVTA